MFRKILSLLIILILTISMIVSGFTVKAAEECTVTVEKVSAITGDEVYVHLYITNNPGIMAMTISITYDSDALEYKDYFYGDVFSDYTVAAHPTRKLIRLVISEKKDITADGIIASFQFKVADNAEYDLHEMTVEYSSGDFCNSDLVRIMPKIVSGGVDVQYNGTNCSHKKFGEWKEKVAPSCDKEGVEQRVCEKCPHAENRSTNPIGHEYSDKWTVDIPATTDMPGTMSRHCVRCSATTDETNFTLEDSEEGDIENKPEAEVPENDTVQDIIDEQHPDISQDQNTSENSSNSSENSSTDNGSNNNSSQTTDSSNTSSDDSSSDSSGSNISSEPDNSVNSDTSDDNSSKDNSDSSGSSVSEDSTSDNKEENNQKITNDQEKDKDKEKEEKKQEKEKEEKKKNEDKIKDIIEIISPEDEKPEETAVNIAEKLREVIPQIDKVISRLKVAFIILFVLILI